VLLLASALAVLAPWLPLRDPSAQPDGLVLRELPPLSRVPTIRLADGGIRYGQDVHRLPDGSVEYRRGERVLSIPEGELHRDWSGSAFFLLGTDGYGRDLTSRLVHGARVSLLVGILAALTALGFGTAVGLAAGLARGWIDGVLMRLTDLFLAVPRLFLALLLVALYGPSLGTTVLVLGTTTWMACARIVRGEVLSLREREFTTAARAAGAHPLRLALCHLLPGALAPVVVEASLRVGDAILLEGALSFLGLGVPPPAPSWGNLVADGRDSLLDAWWLCAIPGLAIAVTVAALAVVGDALRERLAPPARAPQAVPHLPATVGEASVPAGAGLCH
jgi:peptide/nickel transport system permease protein